MHARTPVLWIAVAALAACSSGTSSPPQPGAPDGGDLDAIDAGDHADARGRVDAPRPGRDDETDGPADHLRIDTSIHPRQVWNEPFDFRMAAYPTTWAIAVVHASMLLRSRCIDFSPDAVLSIALKESKLGCTTPGSASIPDGCFQIESTSAYVELRQMFGARFAADHGAIISGDHVETSALAMAHYLVFSAAMLRKYTSCPRTWFDAHPDPQAEQKVLCGAYNRGLWWTSLPAIFASCADRDVLGCFGHDIASDHASAIADYTRGFEAQPVFDAEIGWDDLAAYWARIRPLYPEVDEAAVLAAMRRTFDLARGDIATLSFKRQIRVVLDGLIAALPAFPSVPEAQASACALGYMSGAACDAAACAPACIPPVPDID